jgi:hypothetical protein
MNEILSSDGLLALAILVSLCLATMFWPEDFWWVWRKGAWTPGVPPTQADLDEARIFGLVMLVAIAVTLIFAALKL